MGGGKLALPALGLTGGLNPDAGALRGVQADRNDALHGPLTWVVGVVRHDLSESGRWPTEYKNKNFTTSERAQRPNPDESGLFPCCVRRLCRAEVLLRTGATRDSSLRSE